MSDRGELDTNAASDGESGKTTGELQANGIGADQFETIRRALVQRRRELGISMSELARQVGVSPSMVSQIERGQTLPSVATLFALASALGATVDAFFADSADGPEPAATEDGEARWQTAPETRARALDDLYVVRRGARATIDIRGGVQWQRLTPGPLTQMEFLELVYEPGAQSDPDLYRHPGFEAVLVLEGTFTIHVGFDTYVLEPGDSIAFPSSLPHRYVNATGAVSRAVTVIVREPLSGSPAPTSIEQVTVVPTRGATDEEAT